MPYIIYDKKVKYRFHSERERKQASWDLAASSHFFLLLTILHAIMAGKVWETLNFFSYSCSPYLPSTSFPNWVHPLSWSLPFSHTGWLNCIRIQYTSSIYICTCMDVSHLTHELHTDLHGDFEILEKLNEFRWFFLWWEMLEKRPILCRSLPSLLTGLPNFFRFVCNHSMPFLPHKMTTYWRKPELTRILCQEWDLEESEFLGVWETHAFL